MHLGDSNWAVALLQNANGIDAAIVLVCLVSALIGFWSGFVWQIIRLVSWLAAFWAAGKFHDRVGSMLGFGLSETLSDFLGFLMIFVGVLLVCYIIAHLAGKLVDALQLGLADRVVGGALGMLKGFLVCGIISMSVLHFLNPGSALRDVFAASYLARMSAQGVAMLWIILFGQ